MQLKKYSTLLLIFCLWIISCRGTDDSIANNNNGGSANVIINVVGTESESGTLEKKAFAEKGATSDNGIQKFVIPFDETDFVTATLSPERSVVKAQASVNPMAATSITELGRNVQYKVAVYDSNGDFVDEKTFTYGQSDPGFQLNGDQNYTFVAYSVNSTSTVPVVSNTPRTLATDKLTNVSGDLMYFKKNMTVSGNDTNYLEVVLKHKYSQITTKLDARQVGNISLVDEATIGPVSASANMNLTDGSLTYNSPGSRTPVNDFQPLNTEIATSTTTLISNTTNTAELNFGTLIVDGIPKENFMVRNLKINPGEKYNLNLRFRPCKANAYTMGFDIVGGRDQELRLRPPANLGVIFDIYKLDDTFNITINGIKIAKDEIRFPAVSTQNVAFADGSKYQSDGIERIWFIEGNASAPVVRVVVDKNGRVTMYGSKASYGRLYPLVLYNGNSFNTVPWYQTGNNRVFVSQNLGPGTTRMNGSAIGKQEVGCAP